MAGFDGSGGWDLPSGFPVVTGTTISSTSENTMNSTVEQSFETCMTIDGQTVPTANIPLGGFRITNLGNASAVTDAARVSQVQNQSYSTLSSVSGTNTVTASASPTPAAIANGQVFRGIAAGTNTGATTLNISSLGAYPIKYGGAALAGGEILINQPFEVMADTSASCMHLLGAPRAASDTATGTVEMAVQTEMEAGSSTTTAVSPGRQQFHPSAAKGWAQVGTSGAAAVSYNVTSITDSGTGQFTITWGTDFSSGNFVVVATVFSAVGGTAASTIIAQVNAMAAGTTEIYTLRVSDGNAADASNSTLVVAFGDQ